MLPVNKKWRAFGDEVGQVPEALESQGEEVSVYLLSSSVWLYTGLGKTTRDCATCAGRNTEPCLVWVKRLDPTQVE